MATETRMNEYVLKSQNLVVLKVFYFEISQLNANVTTVPDVKHHSKDDDGMLLQYSHRERKSCARVTATVQQRRTCAWPIGE